MFNWLFGKKEEEKKELTFRVIPYGRKSYVLEYSTGGRWKSVTRTMHYYVKPIDRHFPEIDTDFDALVEKGRKFKENPASFDEYNKRQDEIYWELVNAREKKKKDWASKSAII